MMLPDETEAVTWTWALGACVAATAISEADMAAPAAPSARMAEMMITGRMRMTPPTNLAGQLLGLPVPPTCTGCASSIKYFPASVDLIVPMQTKISGEIGAAFFAK